MWWKPKSIGLNGYSRSMAHDLEDLMLVGDHIFTLGVPLDSDIEFRKRVLAAAKSYYAGLKSIDYTLKRYGDNWRLENQYDEIELITLEITQIVKDHVINALEYCSGIADKPDRPNLIACSAALVRLQNTFQASVTLIRNGFHFEATALQRTILEQLAWISAIHKIDHEKRDFFKIKPSSCIGALKELFPESGMLYGMLSEASHISPKETLKYIRRKENELYIEFKSSILSLRDAWSLLYLTDIFVVLSEYIYADLISEWKNVIRNADGSFSPKSDRLLYKKVIEYNRSIEELERDKSHE